MNHRYRTGSMIWLARSGIAVFSAIIASLLASIVLSNVCWAASNVARQLQYRARHSVFGDIGTYTNTIQPVGDTTTIRTDVHLNVSALGVVLHREDAERVERWRGGTLREFHGTTTVNGVATNVDGKADGNAFVIVSPLGRVTAPPTIRPSNPWSSDILHSTTMMLTDTGKVEQVRISGGDTALINIGGSDIRTQKYLIEGSLQYKIWIDRDNIPVAFAVDDKSGEVFFYLVR